MKEAGAEAPVPGSTQLAVGDQAASGEILLALERGAQVAVRLGRQVQRQLGDQRQPVARQADRGTEDVVIAEEGARIAGLETVRLEVAVQLRPVERRGDGVGVGIDVVERAHLQVERTPLRIGEPVREEERVFLTRAPQIAHLAQHELPRDQLDLLQPQHLGQTTGRDIAVPNQLGGAKQRVAVEAEAQLQVLARHQIDVSAVERDEVAAKDVAQRAPAARRIVVAPGAQAEAERHEFRSAVLSRDPHAGAKPHPMVVIERLDVLGEVLIRDVLDAEADLSAEAQRGPCRRGRFLVGERRLAWSRRAALREPGC